MRLATMKAFYLLCFSVAITSVAARIDSAWKVNNEYRYAVRTRTLTAMPNLKDQWTGLMTKADLIIRPLSTDLNSASYVGKIQNAEYAEWNDVLPNGWNQDVPEEELHYKPMNMTSKPFEVHLSYGAVHSISVDKSMTNTELNHLKGLISQLQVDTQHRNLMKSKHNVLFTDEETSQSIYKVMEPTVSGKCETLYDIVKLPKYILQTYPEYHSKVSYGKDDLFYEITKTKNYSHCEERMGYHFGISGSNDWKVNTNTMGSLSKSGISRIIVAGNYTDYTIRSSTTINRVVKENPSTNENDRSESMVISYVNLTLVSMEESSSDARPNSSELVNVGNLVYSYNLPSSQSNDVRSKKDSSEETDKWNEDSNSSEEKRSKNYKDDFDYKGRSEHKQSRGRRSINGDHERNHISKGEEKKSRKHHSSSSSESDSTSSSSESSWEDRWLQQHDTTDYHRRFYQPKPTLRRAPKTPLLSLFVGDNGNTIHDQLNAKEEVMKLAREMSEDMENPNELPKQNTLSKFNILSSLIRTMNSEQISETSRALVQNNYGKKIWQLYRDATVWAGTAPAVDEVMNWIENYHVKGEEAAELIATLPKAIREPTPEMQKRFFNFVKDDAVRTQTDVKVTAGLAFTQFMYRAQINDESASKYYPVDVYGRFADKKSEFVVREVIPYFAEELRSAVKDNDRAKALYAIRALGNLGHSLIPSVFEPYLEGKTQTSDFQRLAMVVALDKYVINYPKAAQTILYRIYQNRGETHETRVAAVFHLMRTNPPAAMLQRMAEYTNQDENKDVRAAVKSALESAAQLKTPKYEAFAKNAKSALNLLKREHQGLQYSRTHLRDYVMKHMEASYQSQMSYIVNRDSYIPSAIFGSAEKNVAGFKSHAEYQAMISSVERLTDLLKGKFDESHMEHERKHWETESNESNNWSAEHIYNLLKMKTSGSRKLEGQILLSIMNTKRFIPFDDETLKHAPEFVKSILKNFQNGYEINYSKFYYQDDVTISFPLETGLPFIYHYRTPTLVQVDGKIQASTTPSVVDDEKNKLRLPTSANLKADLKVVYSMTSDDTVGFLNPSTHQKYSAGYQKKAQANLPIRMNSQIDLVKREIETEIEPLHTDKETKMFHISSWPYTGRKDVLTLRPMAESKYTKTIHVRPERQINYKFGKATTGFEFTIRGQHEKQYSDLTTIYNHLREQDPMSLFLFGQRTISPEHYAVEIIYNPMSSTTKSVKISMKYDSRRADDKEQKMNHPRDVNANNNLAMPDSMAPNSEERRVQYLRNVVHGLSTKNAKVMDFAVEFKGDENKEYVATISTAHSAADEKSRLLFFLHTHSSNTPSSLYMQVDTKYRSAPELNDKDYETRDVSAESDIKLAYGNLNAKDEISKVFAKVSYKQNQSYKQYVHTLSRDAYYENANTMNEIKAVLTTEKLSPVARKYIERLYNYVRFVTYANHREEHFETMETRDNEITMEANFAPNMKSATFNVATPNMRSNWEDINLPSWISRTLTTQWNWRSVSDRLTHEAIKSADTCSINEYDTKTFDDQSIKHKFGRTWYLAVHKSWPINHEPRTRDTDYKRSDDEKNVLMVLVRDVYEHENEKSNGKEVLIISRDHDDNTKLILKPNAKTTTSTSASNPPRLYVNDKETELKPDQETVIYSRELNKPWGRAYINRYGELKLQVRNETLEITYNGERVQVKNRLYFRNNQGICGAYTGEPKINMKSPNNFILRKDNDFIASWALVDEESSQQLKQLKQRINQDEDHSSEKVYYGNAISNQQSLNEKKTKNSDRSNEGKSCQVKHQTQYVEKDNQICFSKRPIPVCSPDCRANGKSIQVVEVSCRDMDDPAAQEYKNQIQRGRSLDMSTQRTTRKLNFSVAKRCE